MSPANIATLRLKRSPASPNVAAGPPSSGNLHTSSAFTLLELLVAMVIIAILSSITLAALGNVKTATNRTVCVTNLRQLAGAVIGYAADNDGALPEPFGNGLTVSWDGSAFAYLGESTGKARKFEQPLKVLQCPEDQRPSIIDAKAMTFPRSYKMSSQPADSQESPMGVVGYWDDASGQTVGMSRRLAAITKPSDTIMLFENFTENSTTPKYIDNWQFRSGNSMGSGWTSAARATGYRADGSKRLYHGKYLNFAMADGHVETSLPSWPYTPDNRWNAIR